jgi:hypothetical protein
MSVTFELQGVQRCLSKLQGLRHSVQRRIIRKGVRAACMVAAKRKSQVPRGKSGLLRKALGYKLAKSRGFTATGVVGPRRGFKRWVAGAGMVDPVRYAHLAEGGTRAHVIKSSAALPFSVSPVQSVKRLAFVAGGRTVVVPVVNHPGTQAQRWLQKIQVTGQSSMATAFAGKVQSELLREAAKAKPSEVDDGK